MLKGKSVNIRTVNRVDLDALVCLWNDAESYGDYLPFSLAPEEQLRSKFDNNGFVSDTSEQHLIVNNDDEIVGLIWGFKSVPYFDAIEVGYQIFNEENRSKGFATDALSTFCRYIFETKRTNRIELRIAVENTASQRVAIKLGFTLEGTSKEAAFSKGRLHDMNLYALLRREFGF